MPGTSLPPDISRSLASALRRIERLERLLGASQAARFSQGFPITDPTGLQVILNDEGSDGRFIMIAELAAPLDHTTATAFIAVTADQVQAGYDVNLDNGLTHPLIVPIDPIPPTAGPPASNLIGFMYVKNSGGTIPAGYIPVYDDITA